MPGLRPGPGEHQLTSNLAATPNLDHTLGMGPTLRHSDLALTDALDLGKERSVDLAVLASEEGPSETDVGHALASVDATGIIFRLAAHGSVSLLERFQFVDSVTVT